MSDSLRTNAHRTQARLRLLPEEDLTEGEREFLKLANQDYQVWDVSVSLLYSSKKLAASLDQLRAAVAAAAEATEGHSRSLTKATWSLVAATAALVLVGMLQVAQ